MFDKHYDLYVLEQEQEDFLIKVALMARLTRKINHTINFYPLNIIDTESNLFLILSCWAELLMHKIDRGVVLS